MRDVLYEVLTRLGVLIYLEAEPIFMVHDASEHCQELQLEVQ